MSMPTPVQPGQTYTACSAFGWASTVYRLGLLLLIALGMVLPSLGEVLAQDARPRVDVVEVDGTITPIMASYIGGAIEDAGDNSAAAVVLMIDTPGGLSSAMDDIIRDILESEVPVVVYTAPRGARAASAGVYISYAAYMAAMAPGTNIGSASPVAMGEGEVDETMSRKVTNDAVARIVNLAKQRGRNAEWAEKAVRDAANITADEALSLGVVDLLAEDIPTLLQNIDGRTVELATGPATLNTANALIEDIEMGWADQFLQLLVDPTVAYLLLSLGSIGIFLEISNPGAIVPGVVGVVALLLGLFGLGTLPINWTGVLLMAFGIILLIVDVFVPSLGILTIGGLASFVMGLYLLLGDSAPPGYAISPVAIWSVTGCLVLFFVLIGGAVVRAQFRKPATGRGGLIGEYGVVRQPLDPAGMIYAHGELWKARTEDGVHLPSGTVVEIASIDGLIVTVRPATSPELPSHREPPAREEPRGMSPEPPTATTSSHTG
jgi:membrane-bound serine protease (ClpP class)